jgi:hypothetical protein
MNLAQVLQALCGLAVLSSTWARAQERLYSVVGTPGDHFANAIANVGDVDRDGIDDLLVGAPYSNDAAPHAGKAVLLSGRTGAVIREVTGTQAGQQIALAVAGTGDLSGDAIPDLLVGAPDYWPSGSGAVLVFSGVDGTLLAELRSGSYPPDLFGEVVRGSSDVDLDGFPDFLAADDTWIHVFSGKTFQRLYRFKVGSFGSMTGIEDLDGDGVTDIAVGSPTAGFHGDWNLGAVDIYSGATGAFLREFDGTGFGESLGSDIVAVPDQDGDHLEDLFVVAAGASRKDERFRVISSVTGNTLRRFDLVDDGLTLGWSVMRCVDLNGDQVPDWIFTHESGSFAPFDYFSKTYFVSGASGERFQILEDLSQDVFRGWGGPVSVGDLNGDGRAEIALHHALPGSSDREMVVLLGNDLYLHVEPRQIAAGDKISFLTREGVPGNPTLLVIEAVNGTPTFSRSCPCATSMRPVARSSRPSLRRDTAGSSRSTDRMRSTSPAGSSQPTRRRCSSAESALVSAAPPYCVHLLGRMTSAIRRRLSPSSRCRRSF